MENQMEVLKNSEFGELGIILEDGKVYFPAARCAEILGYKRPGDAIAQHCRYTVKRRIPHPQSPNKEIGKKEMENEIKLTMLNNRAVADSRQMAEHFAVNHRDFIAKIDEVVSELKSLGAPSYFIVESIDPNNQERCYLITKDGFALLGPALGKRNLDWEIRYLEAFKNLEDANRAL